ncbi:MFS transporter [Klebsiella variicola subsp. variicola]|uniref:MFS transporter n=1 Tax=Klebsiella pneumoniae complex TaxID=3390273 RepID=UPI0019D3FFBE|nr:MULTISPECIES: MFS transporter [Klebsiella]MBN7740906.1 MFS transporter [Klebsiella variicola]MBR8614345.1 MFS transporter [Klebsiella pneumoniae subsp. pneumoniae]MDR4648138.1 MFS transporter [Klebsiella pneumoniae]HCM5172091.1 MFS transporter [Klebsiella pneumoniae]HCU0960976.1 MFS transporter [Klebsiella pneumoniae]
MSQLAEKKEKIRFLPRAHTISWLMLLVTTLAILMNSIDRLILPTLMPAIIKEFDLTTVQAGWLNSLSFVGTFIGALVLGFISDYIGSGYKRARSWLIAVVIEIAAGVATAFCSTYNLFMALRVFMGLGTGGSEPINVALIGEWWQKENRGFAIGVHHTGFPLGQFIGPVLIGLVIALTSSWRDAFLFIPMLGIPIIIVQMFIATKKNQERVYNWIDDHGMTPPEIISIEKPLTFIETLREGLKCLANRNCLSAIILIFCFIWAEMGVATFLTLQLTQEVGLDLATAAIISGASGITGWLGQIFWGGFSDVKGRKYCLAIIVVGWVVATVGCNFITSVTSGWLILIFWGLFRNSPFPVVYALLIDSAPKTAASSMGLMIGIAVGSAGFLVAPFAGWIITDFGFTTHYIIIAAIMLLSFIPLSLVRETVKKS